MPPGFRRRLRQARRGLWYLTAVSLVLMALAAGIVSQLLPLAEQHPERIAAWLSARAGRPIAFDRVNTEWTRRGPLLRLDGLRVGEGRDAIPIGAAEILVSQYAGLLPGRSFTELRIRNLDLTLERADDGRWRVRGLPGQELASEDPLSALEGLGELQLIDTRLGIVAPSLKINATVPDIDLRMQVDGERVRAGARARMRADGAPLDVVLDFDRGRGNGRVYAAAKDAVIADWARLLHGMGVQAVAGGGRAEAWVDVRGHRVQAVAVDADLRGLHLRGAPYAASAASVTTPAMSVAMTPAMTPGNATITTTAAASSGTTPPAADAIAGVSARPPVTPSVAKPAVKSAVKSAASAPTQRFDTLEMRAQWQAGRDGWRFDASHLRVRVTADAPAQSLDGLVLAGGGRYALLAERIDAAPLFAVVALSDRLSPQLRRWLTDARPGAVLRKVEVVGARGGPMRAQAQVENLRFASVGTSPGLSGLGGDVRGDGASFAIDFDPAARPRLDWPRGFGVPHDLRLRGRVVLWREDGWRVETPGLRIDGQGYGADARGGLWFQADGSRPWVGLAIALDDTQGPVAKRFWPRHAMSPALVRWLDNAILGGCVCDGRVLLHGDLDDWPFIARDGRPPTGVFDARARLRDFGVKFNPDWPATEMNADIAFIGNGFEVGGSARLAEVQIADFSAGIENFRDSLLAIEARADADAAKLLDLLRQSPLQREHGRTFANLGAVGPASASFAMRSDLKRKDADATEIRGDVALRGVRLSESEWKLSFAAVTGAVRYDRRGFTADGLRALYDRLPGRLSLRAGAGHVRDARQGFEAELEATMTTDDLLARAADMGWLKPYVSGRSRWTAAIAIPVSTLSGASRPSPRAAMSASPAARPVARANAPARPAPIAASRAAASAVRLQLRSDLIGTTLSLPAPMDKAAGQGLPTTIELDMPGAGTAGIGDIQVGFGQRLAVRARNAQGQLGIRALFGAERVNEAPPASGLVLSGRTPTLAAIDWIALLRGGNGQQGGGLPLRRVDVQVDRLALLGGVFADTTLGVQPANAGLAVQLDGPTLAGTLQVPDAAGATITGRLQRVHWRSPDKNPAKNFEKTPAVAAAPTAGNDTVDPAKVPPLNLRIDDLRVAGAVLGDTQFRSRPTATGMEISQLQTRAPKLRLDLTGDWAGRTTGARTRLSAVLASEDFGGFLDGLGMGGRVAGGKGDARFDAAWPGSPMDFALARLEGNLKLNVRDGRLVEVEPGAGRVFGLLSLAEIPRRLSLDFRDFFSKGFAFNSLGGNVRFTAGSASSEDFAIDGPAARINIRGAADMRAQTFDQTIEVLPKAGNLLTAVGAIAGGPVGAAVGAVANAVLQKPIGQMAAKNYRVTGPWRDPKVEAVERPAAAPRQRAAGQGR